MATTRPKERQNDNIYSVPYERYTAEKTNSNRTTEDYSTGKKNDTHPTDQAKD